MQPKNFHAHAIKKQISIWKNEEIFEKHQTHIKKREIKEGKGRGNNKKFSTFKSEWKRICMCCESQLFFLKKVTTCYDKNAQRFQKLQPNSDYIYHAKSFAKPV